MAIKFTKKNIVGVSITPGIGIEAAVVDFEKKEILGYAQKSFDYDAKRPDSLDLDLFKDHLLELLTTLQVPEGTGIVLSLPTPVFAVKDLPASLDSVGIDAALTEIILANPLFEGEGDEPVYNFAKLNNSTIQFNKIAYAAFPKSIILEMALQIKELKYKLLAIDSSVNSYLNALVFSGKVDIAPDFSWTLLIVDNSSCKVIPMQGYNYVDCFEDKMSIGKVLGDDENYDIVVNTINPILKIAPPSKLLYVVSKTDLISAKILSEKINYNAQIVHLESNMFSTEPVIELNPDVDSESANFISADVIGAAIRKNVEKTAPCLLNLFNEQLGSIYINQTPLKYKGYELTIENMTKVGAIFAIVVLGLCYLTTTILKNQLQTKQTEISSIDNQIAMIQKFLDENKEVSTAKFSEIDELRAGIAHNKDIYSFYTIVGADIPKKLWLTGLDFDNKITIEGQADNLESVYSFYRNIKDYIPSTDVKLKHLGLAGNSAGGKLSDGDNFDTDSVLTSLNADYYEFKISNAADKPKEVTAKEGSGSEKEGENNLELEPIKDMK